MSQSHTHTVTAICLNLGGTVREFSIPSSFSVDNFDIEQIPLPCRKYVGTNAISRECDYSYLGNKVSVFAFTEGRLINKHELPPPIDEETYYGNIYIVCHDANGELVDFTEDDYESFYTSSFGGFEEINDESERSEDDEDDDGNGDSDGEDLKDFIDDDEDGDSDDEDYEDDGHGDSDDDIEDEVTEEDIQEWRDELETIEVYIETMRSKNRDIKSSIMEKYESIKSNLRSYDSSYRD